MNSLQYFGTNTTSAGHYFFNFDATGQYMSSCDIQFGSLPFNPEDYGKEKTSSYPNYRSFPNGTVQYEQIGGYSVLAIAGSPIDKRGGCKSVFFMLGDFSKDQLIQKIKMTPAAMKIINQMPFHVEHFKEANPIEA